MAQTQTDRKTVSVHFFACGAETHPAFSDAKFVQNPGGLGYYTLQYPIHIAGINRSEHAQKVWADDKVRHLKSWGAEGIIRW